MNQTLPTGVIFAKIINILQIVILVAMALFLLFLPGIIFKFIPAENFQEISSGMPLENVKSIILGIAVFLGLLSLVSAAGIYFINRGLSQLNRSARIWHIILAVFSLFYFPIGTILYGISLYFMLFEDTTKRAFDKQETAVN